MVRQFAVRAGSPAPRSGFVLRSDPLRSNLLGSWIDAHSIGYTPDGLTLADIQWDNSLPQMQKVLSADQVFALNALYLENTLTAVADRNWVNELSKK